MVHLHINVKKVSYLEPPGTLCRIKNCLEVLYVAKIQRKFRFRDARGVILG